MRVYVIGLVNRLSANVWRRTIEHHTMFWTSKQDLYILNLAILPCKLQYDTSKQRQKANLFV